jgi:hypothetical protein
VFRVINTDLGVLPAKQWLSALDASGLLMSVPAVITQGIALSGGITASGQRPVATQLAISGTGPCASGHAVPRPRVESVSAAAVYGIGSAAKRLGRAAATPASNHNSTVMQYATKTSVDGVGTSGPPRRQEPA